VVSKNEKEFVYKELNIFRQTMQSSGVEERGMQQIFSHFVKPPSGTLLRYSTCFTFLLYFFIVLNRL
jgi:hypothetical protein